MKNYSKILMGLALITSSHFAFANGQTPKQCAALSPEWIPTEIKRQDQYPYFRYINPLLTDKLNEEGYKLRETTSFVPQTTAKKSGWYGKEVIISKMHPFGDQVKGTVTSLAYKPIWFTDSPDSVYVFEITHEDGSKTLVDRENIASILVAHPTDSPDANVLENALQRPEFKGRVWESVAIQKSGGYPARLTVREVTWSHRFVRDQGYVSAETRANGLNVDSEWLGTPWSAA